MDEWTLADFLATYPSIQTKGFQTLISAKKEFNQLASSINEPTPKKGDRYNHQELFLRYMREYNDIFIADSAGSGKSCEIDGLTEYLLSQHLLGDMEDVPYDVKNAHYKRTIVLVKGPSLINEFKYQLACKCTKQRYDKAHILQGTPLTIQAKKLISKEIAKWYKFYTYETFAKHIKEKYGTKNIEAMRIDYNHSNIVVDEAHNLFIDEDVDKTNQEDRRWNKEKTYKYLFHFFHYIKYCKKILATATPMLNSISEIGKLMNLILPDDLQLPTSDKKNQLELETIYQNMTLEEIEPYFRGRITYVRAFETGAIRQDQVNPNFTIDQGYLSDLIYMTEMSKFQSLQYKNTEDIKGKVSYSLYLNYASNFVYPDGSLSKPEQDKKISKKSKINAIKENAANKIPNFNKTESDESDESDNDESDNDESESDESQVSTKKTGPKVGYNKYIVEKTIKTGKKKQTIYHINTTAKPLLKLNNIQDVAKYSSKYAAIIKILNKDKGSTFIYGRYNTGSGNIILGLCLEAVGYERYIETTSMFQTVNETGENLDYCRESNPIGPADTVGQKILNKNLTKKPRYALLTSETLNYDTAFNSIMELMNSYENRYGEYLECIIASRVVRDGLNFKNIKKIIITGPDWNPSSLYQAISRGIRAGSHDELLAENPNFVIQVYQMAAVPNPKYVDNTGVDLHIYNIAFNKDKNISQMMLKIAQFNIGCQINYNRNVRETDQDDSPACYYQPCLYQCADPFYTTVDYSTYNAYYIDEDVQKLIHKLKILLSSGENMYKVGDLFQLLGLLDQNDKTVLTLALEYMILNKVQILDTWGYINYLYEDNEIYYIARSYTNLSINNATVHLIAYENTTEQVYNALDLKNYNQFLKEDTVLDKKFENLSINNKIKFLESFYFDYPKKYQTIIDHYQNMFFKLDEIMVKETTAKKLGRPTKDKKCVGTEVKTGNTIYINMLPLLKETNKHNLIPFYFKANSQLRIYDQ